MLILGIDTSCDDTAASVVENGRSILSNIVSSQDDIHRKYGGIVPELASRRHIQMIWPIVDESLATAGVSLDDMEGIAVCHGPGLIGSLLVGVCFAKSLSLVKTIPLVAVNHLEGHVFSVFLEQDLPYPFLSFVVSGGHTCIYRIDAFRSYREIARTRDDAAGEAFDKVAKLLGLGYPGGPLIDQLASRGDPQAIAFPRARLKGSLDFSFSGLKTAVLNYVTKNPHARKEDIAASFQNAVVDVLTERILDVARSEGINRISLAGGVSANRSLRDTLSRKAHDEGIQLFLPSRTLCTDNAAMIAAAGYDHLQEGNVADFDINPKAYLPLTSAAG